MLPANRIARSDIQTKAGPDFFWDTPLLTRHQPSQSYGITIAQMGGATTGLFIHHFTLTLERGQSYGRFLGHRVSRKNLWQTQKLRKLTLGLHLHAVV